MDELKEIIGKTIDSVEENFEDDGYTIHFTDNSYISISGSCYGNMMPDICFYDKPKTI